MKITHDKFMKFEHRETERMSWDLHMKLFCEKSVMIHPNKAFDFPPISKAFI